MRYFSTCLCRKPSMADIFVKWLEEVKVMATTETPHSSCAEGSPSEIGVLRTVTNPRQQSLCGSATQAWKHKPINQPKSCDSRNFSNDFWVDFAWTSVGGQNFVCTVTCIVWKPPPRAKSSQDVHVGIDLLLFFFFTGHTYSYIIISHTAIEWLHHNTGTVNQLSTQLILEWE